MKSAQELGVPWRMGVIGGGYFSGTEMVRAGAPEHAAPVQFCAGLDGVGEGIRSSRLEKPGTQLERSPIPPARHAPLFRMP